MIRFVDATFERANATVRFGTDENKAFSERDAEGNITVSVDMQLIPDHGEDVHLTLHAENNSEFVGVLHKVDKDLVFVNRNETQGC